MFKFLTFYVLVLSSLSAIAQQKDSAIIKPKEIKEELNSPKKRKYTYFISNRICDDDKFDVFKMILSDKVPALVVIRGRFEVLENSSQKRAKILVYNASNNELVGIYNTNSYTGNYLLILAPNVKYLFKVEVSGYGTTQEIVEIPLKIDYEICQQELKIKLNEKQKPVLIINSFFADENEKVFYLKSVIDTTKVNSEDLAMSMASAQNNQNKTGKEYSSIDELVKKQLEEEKKKPEEALKAFKNNDFERALSIYESLLKNDPADPFVNYYYGVCMLKLDKNKAKAINSLLIASSAKEVPFDVYLYLGKAYHLSYLFNDAIKAFEAYKAKEKPYEFEHNNGLIYIKNCINGANLMNDQKNIEVVKRLPIQLNEILSHYNPDLINERVKIKTEFFNSTIDKKKQTNQLITNIHTREYFHVSYGEKDQNQTDLYINKLLPNGTLGNSISAGYEINSTLDENYPYISKDGNTLYFSSKGHNSMGGYDIFKCTRRDSLSAWSKPENMGYPINSTYDDLLFIPDENSQSASFCTNRKNNNFEYLQIKMPKLELASSIIKGKFSTTDSIPKKEAIITVYNSNTGEIAGVFKTSPTTGLYLMVLNSGTKYDISVESEGHSELTSSFEIPDKKGEFELKQTIELQNKNNSKAIKVNNYFTALEASKISFENTISSKNTDLSNKTKGATNSENKVIKNKKPKRSAEEAQKDKEDLKVALDLYNQSLFQEASIAYKHLDVYIDLEPMDNYRYGMCLYNITRDKVDCINALEASTALKTVPIDVYYYLAKSYQMGYRFSTAINYYQKFISLSKVDEVKRLNIEQEIKYCNSGIKLVNNPVVLEVYAKKHVDQNAIHNSLTDIESGGKILVIADDMKSVIDKKKNFNSLIYLTPEKNSILFSSYGENEANGKDIYQLKKIANGKWATIPVNISTINTPYDEEYPALSKDGKTLYFSSKGHENMGGYDIFKSEWNENTQTWSAPVNLGSPINSPFDDIYFLE